MTKKQFPIKRVLSLEEKTWKFNIKKLPTGKLAAVKAVAVIQAAAVANQSANAENQTTTEDNQIAVPNIDVSNQAS